TLLVDTDGDDKADKEIVVADGWKPLDHGADALGVALDRDGNVYFAWARRITPTRTCSRSNPTRATTSRTSAARSSKVRPTSASVRSWRRASASRWGCGSTPGAICSRPTRKARPGCLTATRSTNCSIFSRDGTTASRRGTPNTYPT